MSVVVDNLPNRENDKIRIRSVLDKYAQAILKPFDWMEAPYLLSKYELREGFISPNSFLYNVVSGIFSLAILVIYFFSIFHKFFTNEFKAFDTAKYFSNVLIFAVYILGNGTNYYNNVRQRYSNVLLALKIQNICEVFKVNGKTLKKYIWCNWICNFALVLSHIVWVFSYSIGFSSVSSLDEIITNVFYVIFDANVLYSSRLTKLILEPLKIWVADAQKSVINVDSENEFYWNRKFESFKEIVETFEILGKTCQLLILFYCIETFMNGLVSIYIRIELAKVAGADIYTIAASSVSLIWMVKNLSLIISLCVGCETFYDLLREVRSTCIQLTATERCSETQKRVCKNIQRVQASFKKMSACGLFLIDAALSMRFFGLLTTYIIVVLQFEFV